MATTTPNYGWDVPTSTDYVKDGATAIETLGDDIDATLYTALGGDYPGLRLVKKQTIGTGVSTVTVTNAFSATYENYKIMVSGGVASTAGDISLRLGSTATGYYNAIVYAQYSTSAVQMVGNNNGDRFSFAGSANTSVIDANIELGSPFLAKNTTFRTTEVQLATAGAPLFNGGYQAGAASFTDFTLLFGGTLTGGTIYVYGYGAS
jgi:hypothetical protein